MEQLKAIKEQLVSCVQSQMGNLDKVDTKELGEVIDMIKDLSKAIYYCSINKAMEEAEKEESKNNTYYYMEKYLPIHSYLNRDDDYYNRGRMYYPYNENSTSWYSENMGRDSREGRSGQSRRTYMESKQTHQDSTKKIQELEMYMKELTNDIMEMLQDASPEEKAVVQKKMNTLVTKVSNV